MAKFINENADMEAYSERTVESMGELLENAKKETAEAAAALPAEAVAREAYSEACIEANAILTGSLGIVQAAFR